MNPETFEIAIIGGGIVGLATAMALGEASPGKSIVVLEKEKELASHQTGRNSGVIHAGIYYKPGSYKAKLCVEGSRLMLQFCEETGVPCDRCGKLIVATTEDEMPRLATLYERGAANGVRGLELLGPERIREIEPHARAVQALFSPETAITDYRKVANAMASMILKNGGRIFQSARALEIRRSGGFFDIATSRFTVRAGKIINCSGLYADRIARMTGLKPHAALMPFRGEYYTLRTDRGLVRGLIYPVPDPRFPFLGVHFTKKIAGGCEAGPNAVLAFAREGYKFSSVNLRDLIAMFSFPGFWAMARRHWKTEAYELYRSVSRKAFLRALQRLVPEVQNGDLQPGGSGVRAQIVMADGSLVDDFMILEGPGSIHVLNAPSPAATASIAIGRHIAGLAAKSF